MDNVRLFIPLEGLDESDHIYELSFNQCLRDILTIKGVAISHGLPVIQVFFFLNKKS